MRLRKVNCNMANDRYGENSKYRVGDVVYLLKRKQGDYKIGKAQNFQNRYYKLCSDHEERFEIIAYADGYTALESALHLAFKEHQRIVPPKNTKSDWFAPVPEILKWFKEYGTMWVDAPLFKAREKPYWIDNQQTGLYARPIPQWRIDEYEEKKRAWEAKQSEQSNPLTPLNNGRLVS